MPAPVPGLVLCVAIAGRVLLRAVEIAADSMIARIVRDFGGARLAQVQDGLPARWPRKEACGVSSWMTSSSAHAIYCADQSRGVIRVQRCCTTAQVQRLDDI